jgi:hypothetical protein
MWLGFDHGSDSGPCKCVRLTKRGSKYELRDMTTKLKENLLTSSLEGSGLILGARG